MSASPHSRSEERASKEHRQAVPDDMLARRQLIVKPCGDDIDIAAAVAWVGEQPERDAGQRDRLLRVVVDGLRPANAPV